MLVCFTANTAVKGIPVTAGEVMDVPESELWRLIGLCEPVKEQAVETPPAEVESRDPEPEHRDPHPRRKSKG